MLRHRKHKKPILSKSFYETLVWDGKRIVTVKQRITQPPPRLVWKGEKADDEGGYYPCIIEYVRGEDGYLHRKLTRAKVQCIEAPKILNEDVVIRIRDAKAQSEGEP